MIRSQVFDISLKFSVREEERKESNASSENAQNPVSVAMEESDSCHLHESPLIFQREVGGDPITASHIPKTFSLPHINPRSKSLYIISKKVIIKDKKKEKKKSFVLPSGIYMFSGKYVLCIALKGSIFMGQHTAIQNIINLGGKHFTSKVLLVIRRSPRPPIPPPDERTHTSREKTHTHTFVNTHVRSQREHKPTRWRERRHTKHPLVWRS